MVSATETEDQPAELFLTLIITRFVPDRLSNVEPLPTSCMNTIKDFEFLGAEHARGLQWTHCFTCFVVPTHILW
jgi:hypothetical protein